MSTSTMESLLNGDHQETHENANMGHTFASAFFKAAGEQVKQYCLEKMYPTNISDAYRAKSLHIHDLDMGVVGYCAGWSLADLLEFGFNGVPTQISSSPPKHLSTAMGQLVNFTGVLQNNWAGAMAFNSVDTLMAPYISRDGLRYEEVEQIMQETIYHINTGSRWGGQTPFVNWSFDLQAPEDLREIPILNNGNTYADFQDEMDMFNIAFLNVMGRGDWKQKVFTFPIPTYNLTKTFDWDSHVTDALMEVTAKYGLPYFQNFVHPNIKVDPSEIRSMCCRLRLNMKEMYHRLGGTFGYGDKTGSVGVVTINLPQAAYLSSTVHSFLRRVKHQMDLASASLEIKRGVVERNIDKGILPWTKRYLPAKLKFHFSTIGLVGMHEAVQMLIGEPISSQSGVALAEKILIFMGDQLKIYQELTGHIYNLEESPAESTGWKMAKHDRAMYPEIVAVGGDEPFYTNSSHLPVDCELPLSQQLRHQERLQEHYTGGTVFHTFMGESNPSPEGVKKLVRRIAENTTIKNFTITPTFSVCMTHGRFGGDLPICPYCGAPTLVYSRVTGYIRPVSHWNPGKQEEFSLRKTFKSPL